MIRKSLSLSVVIAFVCLLTPNPAYAASFAQERQEYQQAYTQYRQDLDQYKVARSEYLTYDTLISQGEAVLATRTMLLSRNDVIRQYLEMVRARIDEAPETYITTAEKDVIRKQTESLQTLLDQQAPAIENAEELEDLVAASKKIDSSIISQMSNLGYSSQALLMIGEARETIASATQLLSVTNDQIIRISTEGKMNTSQMERWLIDAEERINLAERSHQAAEGLFRNANTRKEIDSLRSEIRKSHQYIKDTNQRIREIIQAIRSRS